MNAIIYSKKSYSNYQHIGLPWLSEIPSHWQLQQLRYVANVRVSGVDKKTDETEIPVKLCNYVDVYYHKRITNDIEFMVASASVDEVKNFKLQAGDVLITKDSESWEDIAVSAYVPDDLPNVICGYHLALIRPYKSMLGRYLAWAFASNSIVYQFNISANGITRYGLSQQAIKGAFFPLPTLREQHAIADFLDQETEKIETLISKKQRLLEMLAERRQALITHAVTKGLNSDTPMKNSGVNWLGEIPKGWKAIKVKFLADKIGSGKTPRGGAEVYVDAGVVFIRSQNVHFDGLRLDDVVFIDAQTDAEMASTRVRPNDVLLNITGASIGRCAYVSEDFLEANVNQHVCIIRPRQKVISTRFLHAVLSSDIIQRQIFSSENGVSREGLNFEQIGNLWLGLPPDIAEQIEIMKYLDQQITKLDRLFKKIQTIIDRLQERRIALISDAVTGKLKVTE